MISMDGYENWKHIYLESCWYLNLENNWVGQVNILVVLLQGNLTLVVHELESALRERIKVTVYTLLMNYSYETVYCCWAESLLLAQISMMCYESAPKIMFCSENLGFIGQSDAFLWLIWLV